MATACSGLGDSDVLADVQGSSSVPMVDPSGAGSGEVAGTVSDVSPYVCRDWTSFRRFALETNLLDVADVISMPVPVRNANGEWEMEPLGVARVGDLVDDLTSVETFCDIGVSAVAASAIERYRAEPDLVVARQILYDTINEEVAPFGLMVGESSAAQEPLVPRTASGDAMEMAGEAGLRGDNDAMGELTTLALELFETESHKQMEGDPSAQELAAIIAGAQLLGLDDLSADALRELREKVKQELIDAWKDATMCAEVDSNRIEQMYRALSTADLIEVPDSPASDGKKAFSRETYRKWLQDWQQRQVDAANGKRFDDCPGNIFRGMVQWPVGDGALEAYLISCDYKNWDGEMSAKITIPADDGTVIYEVFFPLAFGPMEDRAGAKATADLEGRIMMSFRGPDATAKVTNVESFEATAEFSINDAGEIRGANLRIDFKPVVLSATVTSDGDTYTIDFPISWGTTNLSGQLSQTDGSCSDAKAG